VGRILTSQYWVFSPNWICLSNSPCHTITSLRPTSAGQDTTSQSRFTWMVGMCVCVWGIIYLSSGILSAWIQSISHMSQRLHLLLVCVKLIPCHFTHTSLWHVNYPDLVSQLRTDVMVHRLNPGVSTVAMACLILLYRTDHMKVGRIVTVSERYALLLGTLPLSLIVPPRWG